jgi:hypothetical protein
MKDPHDPHYWGKEIPHSEVINPVVFNFRPDKFLAVDAEHRKDWEKFFHENVGVPPRSAVESAPGRMLPARYPNGGISGSNGGWDD